MKRGQLDITVMQAIMIVITAFLLVFFVPKLYESANLLANPTKVPTLASMKELVGSIDLLIADPDKNAEQSVPIYVEDGKKLVGFSTGVPSVLDKCTNERIERPLECGTASCICIYDDGSLMRCEKLPKISGIYSLRNFDGQLWMNGELSPNYGKVGPYFTVDDTAQSMNSLGGDIAYPNIPEVAFPEKLSSFVLHGYCDLGLEVEAASWLLDIQMSYGTNPVYIEKYVNNGFNHILLTPQTKFTDERFTTIKRGLPVMEAEALLKKAMTYPVCGADVTGFCFDPERYGQIYARTRATHSEPFTDSVFLLQFGERLRLLQSKYAKQVYLDYVTWFPNEDGAVEAYYNLARLTYAPEAVTLQKVKLLPGNRELILEAIGHATKGLARVQPTNPYWNHAYYVRGLYFLALQDYRQASRDLLTYEQLEIEKEFTLDNFWEKFGDYGEPRYELDKGLVDVYEASDYSQAQEPLQYVQKHQEEHNAVMAAHTDPFSFEDAAALIKQLEPNYKIHLYAYLIPGPVLARQEDHEALKEWNEHLTGHTYKPLAEYAEKDLRQIEAGQQSLWITDPLEMNTDEFFFIAHEK